MNTRTTAAILADFEPNFPSLSGLGNDADRIPGRDLAQMIASGLEENVLKLLVQLSRNPFSRSTVSLIPTTIQFFVTYTYQKSKIRYGLFTVNAS